MSDPGKPAALEAHEARADGRRASPSVARNRDAIHDALAETLPAEAHVLEIASGTGEHGIYMTERRPGLTWTFSDPDAEARNSIAGWMAHTGESARRRGPLDLRTDRDGWTEAVADQPFDAVFCANMIHIAPWAAGRGLILGAGQLLRPGGALIVYGPFARDGDIAPSNARFSEDLARRDPAWGVRDLDRDLVPLADTAGLGLDRVVAMPANNLTAIFRKHT